MTGRIKGITVEIGGDTTKLQSALKGVNKNIRSTQTELKDVNKLLKLDPGNTELLAQKQKLLTDAVSRTSDKLETLKTAAEQAQSALASGDITQSQYDALQREIIETEGDLKKLTEEANKSSSTLDKLAQSGAKFKSTGETITSAGTKMLPASAAVTGLGAAAVATAASFESSMSQVQATMGITTDSMSTIDDQSVNTMDSLGNLAKEMGSTTAFSASQCADALNYLALAGYDTQGMADTLPTVLNLAAAGNIDLADASDMVTDAMSALGLGVDDASTMVDQMAKTSSSTNTSVSQLGQGILTIGATAKTVKGGTAELNTALGILANNGVKGAEGGTHLRNIILSLQSPTDKAAGALDDLGVAVYDSQGNMRSMNDILGDLNGSMASMTSADKTNIISSIFNKTDLSSVNALLANTGSTWGDLQSSIADSGGSAEQMADTQLNNLNGQLTMLKSALEGLAISFGELLLPAIKLIASALQGFVDFLNNTSDTTKTIIVVIGLLVGALGPVLIIVGKVISAAGSIMTIIPKVATTIKTLRTVTAALNATMLANPIVLIIAAIAALMAAFVYLWNTSDAFRQFWIGLWDSVKNATTTAWNAITSFLTGVWSTITESITSAVNAIKNGVTSAWNALKNTVISITTGIKTGILEAFNSVKSGISGTIDSIYTTITGGFNHAVDFIKGLAQSAYTWGADIIAGIVSGITSKVSAITQAVSGVASKIRSFLHFSTPDTGPLADYEQWMPDFMAGLASGIKSSQRKVTDAIAGVSTSMVVRPQALSSSYGRTGTTETSDNNDMVLAITKALKSGQSTEIVVPVYIGGTKLDEVIVNANKRSNLRSGGR